MIPKPVLLLTLVLNYEEAHLDGLREPETFLHELSLPPHTPHLSSFVDEFTTWSHPALTHWPRTQMARVSGPHRVPSITCSRRRERKRGYGGHRGSPWWGRERWWCW